MVPSLANGSQSSSGRRRSEELHPYTQPTSSPGTVDSPGLHGRGPGIEFVVIIVIR